MEIKIQIADDVYAQLLNRSTRMPGSIGLVSPTEGNFNAHRKKSPRPGTHYMKLPHGRISVSADNVRMHLCIHRDECIDAPQAILGESIDASSFVEFMTDEEMSCC